MFISRVERRSWNPICDIWNKLADPPRLIAYSVFDFAAAGKHSQVDQCARQSEKDWPDDAFLLSCARQKILSGDFDLAHRNAIDGHQFAANRLGEFRRGTQQSYSGTDGYEPERQDRDGIIWDKACMSVPW